MEICKASAGQAGRKEIGCRGIVWAGMKRMAAGGVGWPAGAGSDEAGGRKVWGSVKK